MAGPDNALGDAVGGAKGYTIVVLCSIAVYNVIELTFIIWAYFKRHSGLYFWSFIVSTYGILIYSVGFLVRTKAPHTWTYAYTTLISVGWPAMVTGQSMVLWSRLHLVLRDQFKLRLLLWMIIIDAVCFHIPTTVLNYGANSNNPDRFVQPYNIFEKIQVTVFFVQELTLSSFYIAETVKLTRLQSAIQYNGRRSRRLMVYLIVVNVLLIILDATILGLEYASLYGYQTAWKALVYSVKLKMEFTILNRLKEITTGYCESTDPSSRSEQAEARRKSLAAMQNRWELNNFRGDMSMVSRNVPDVSYEAYVHGGGQGQEDLERQQNSGSSGENEVVMTTEIVMRSETRSESEADLGKSKMTPFAEGVAEAAGSCRRGSNTLSKSSSELHLHRHNL